MSSPRDLSLADFTAPTDWTAWFVLRGKDPAAARLFMMNGKGFWDALLRALGEPVPSAYRADKLLLQRLHLKLTDPAVGLPAAYEIKFRPDAPGWTADSIRAAAWLAFAPKTSTPEDVLLPLVEGKPAIKVPAFSEILGITGTSTPVAGTTATEVTLAPSDPAWSAVGLPASPTPAPTNNGDTVTVPVVPNGTQGSNTGMIVLGVVGAVGLVYLLARDARPVRKPRG